MNRLTALLLLSISFAFAEDREKTEKKALDLQAKTFVNEAKALEKSGQFLEARTRYAMSQSFTDTKDATQAIKRIDDEIHKRAKDALRQAHQLYDQGKFDLSAAALEEASKLGALGSVFSYNLALCYRRLGDNAKALGHLDRAASAAADPKRRLKMRQMRTALITGEQPPILKNEERDRINGINQLMEGIGFEPSAGKPAVRSAGLCQSLQGLAMTPAIAFNLANCAEDSDRLAEASQLLGRYLEMAPNAADADRVRLRIAKSKALTELPEQTGVQVRALYASASRSLEERKYDRALADFQKAAEAAPSFAPTQWRLALMNEAMGNVDGAQRYFAEYRRLESDPAGREEADLHLNTLEIKRGKYDEEVDRASEILSDLFNRAMNLTFNGLEDRTAQYKHRAKERAAMAAKHKVRMVGGFTIPFAYAQQQLADAGEHLASALLLFPLGAEANQLMALVFLQANDGRSSMRSFDAVSSQNLPAAFYAEMRGKNRDHAVKCELTREGMRLIYLSSYDKKAKPTAPAKPAGEDGLGDLVIDPWSERAQDFESMAVTAAEIKSIETKNGHLVLKLAKEEITLSPIYLPAFPPADGPAGRRFGNNYTRLFVRYPGLEESKLGNEGMTGFEKIKLGYDIANAAYGISAGLNPLGAVDALQTFIQISREIHSVAKSLRVNFAAWEKTIEDQRELQAGNAFKPIPTEPASLKFVEEIK